MSTRNVVVLSPKNHLPPTMLRQINAAGWTMLAASKIADMDVLLDRYDCRVGLVCLDAAGMLHFASAADHTGFESCVEQVVKTWTSKNESTSQSSFDELVEGMAVYRQSVDRIAAESASAKK